MSSMFAIRKHVRFLDDHSLALQNMRRHACGMKAHGEAADVLAQQVVKDLLDSHFRHRVPIFVHGYV